MAPALRWSYMAAALEPHGFSGGAMWLQRWSYMAAAQNSAGCSAGAIKLQRWSHIVSAVELVISALELHGCSAGVMRLQRWSYMAAALEPQNFSGGAMWLQRWSHMSAALNAETTWLQRWSHIAEALEPCSCSAGVKRGVSNQELGAQPSYVVTLWLWWQSPRLFLSRHVLNIPVKWWCIMQ
ncbi:hypothetical protein HaLaN_02703, partial [Haematococcus lacustris]